MQGDEYQQLAARTFNPDLSLAQWLNNCVWGLFGETGELVDLLKKIVFHQHYGNVDDPGYQERLHAEQPELVLKLNKEMGDILWYLSQTARLLGISLDEMMSQNIEKLRQRYPASFNAEGSIARPDEG